MYIPKANRIDDRETIYSFLEKHGFATVITTNGVKPCASHLPVLFANEGANGILRSHMARANGQWRHFASGQEVLCIFHGPHSYISPSSYVMQETVPTWNYAVVHVYGIASVTEDQSEVRRIVDDTTKKYESYRPIPWAITLSEDAIGAMLRAIVGFSIRITSVEAKFKLGQNLSQADQDGMLHDLRSSDDAESRALANFIAAHRNEGHSGGAGS